MPGNPFNNPTIDMMYSDAVLGLMNGCLMPWDKQVLAAAPIPSAVIEPYMEKEIPDVRESMRLTYETMVVWIDEAKKVNYFSKRFVQLSKMIMNGVTTMGRGLITLHARGEEPAGVPMSIQDLIGVASYHFRKSHLGVLQTVRSHPEISERLLMNQISWNNMLMRLFKTKEKLESGVRCQVSGVSDQVSGIEDQGTEAHGDCLPAAAKSAQGAKLQLRDNGRSPLPTELADAVTCDALLPANEEKESGVSGQVSCRQLPGGDFDAFKVFGPEDRGFSEPCALREPGALSAPRALRAMGNSNAECGIRNAEEKENSGARIEEQGREAHGGEAPARNLKCEAHSLPGRVSRCLPAAAKSAQGTVTCDALPPENEEGKTADNKKSEIRNKKSNSGNSDQVSEVRDSGTRVEEQGSSFNEEGRMKNEEVPDGNSDPSSFLLHNSSLDEDSSLDDGTPPYLKILQNVYARGGPADNGKLNFTFDEVCYLAADPDFGRIYPGAAERMRSLLEQLDTG